MKKKFILVSVGAALLLGSIFLITQKIFHSSQTKVFVTSQESENNEPSIEKQEESILEKDEAEEIPEENFEDKQDEEKMESSIDKKTETVPFPQDNQTEAPATDLAFVKKRLVSWGFQRSSTRKIDTLVIHSSYDALGDDPYDLEGLIKEYKVYEVAAHYLIDRKGNVYQLVENNNIAYHAGISSVPDGRTNVNFFSIGIELMNTKEDKFTSAQYSSLNKLLVYLKSTYSIKYTLGHDDIAPGRKDDPWNFDWDKID